MKLPITRLSKNATLPEYQTEGAAAMDLHACLDSAVTIEPMERAMAPTGLAIAVPKGHEAQIRARSGLAHKYGIALVNGVGTIDSDYRGEIGILLINLGKEPFVIEPDMRIAQLVVARYEQVTLIEKNKLGETKRSDGGFGSTGTHEGSGDNH